MQKIKVLLVFWVAVLLANQIFIFGACFSPHCILSAIPHTLAISAVLYFIFYHKSKNKKINLKEKESPPQTNKPTRQKTEVKNRYTQTPRPKSYNQKKGDVYERYIGGKFEEKGNIVIYNGFIRGYEDKGMDIIVLSKKRKTINLVQCKNWTRKPMSLEDVKSIYKKLDVHYNDLDLYYLPTSEIHKHTQQTDLSFLDFDNAMHDLRSDIGAYKIQKTLYVASENVIDLEIGKYLIMVKENIYRYREMKIVVERMQKEVSGNSYA